MNVNFKYLIPFLAIVFLSSCSQKKIKLDVKVRYSEEFLREGNPDPEAEIIITTSAKLKWEDEMTFSLLDKKQDEYRLNKLSEKDKTATDTSKSAYVINDNELAAYYDKATAAFDKLKDRMSTYKAGDIGISISCNEPAKNENLVLIVKSGKGTIILLEKKYHMYHVVPLYNLEKQKKMPLPVPINFYK